MYAGSSALSQVDRNPPSYNPTKNEIAGYSTLLPFYPTEKLWIGWLSIVLSHAGLPHHYRLSGVDASCSCSPLLSVACMHQNYTDSINTASSKTETSSLGNLVKSWNVGYTLLSPSLSSLWDYKPGQKRSQVKWKGSFFLPHFNALLLACYWFCPHVGTATSQLVSRVFIKIFWSIYC